MIRLGFHLAQPMPAMSFRPDVAEIPPRPLWDWVGMTHGQWANMGPILGLTGLLLATCRCYGHQHLSAEEAPFHNCLLPSSRLSLPLVLSKQAIAHHNHSISSRGPLLPLPFLVPLAPVGPRGTLLTPSPPNWIFRCSVLGSRLPLTLPDGYFGPSTFGLIATARPPFQSPAVPCIDAPRSSPAPPQHPFCRTGGTGGTLGGIGGTQWLASPHTPTHSGAETTTHPPCLLDRVGASPPPRSNHARNLPHPTWIELASNSLLFNQTTPAPVAAQTLTAGAFLQKERSVAKNPIKLGKLGQTQKPISRSIFVAAWFCLAHPVSFERPIDFARRIGPPLDVPDRAICCFKPGTIR
ncbi:hypothetical protein PABG_06920 [Paracoccidioides brasiliensis Pb03]|nr:hypothetical protein PABG_06920 [Paracoccidioides brasiliensis Pb03]